MQVSVRSADRTLVQLGTGLGDISGCTIEVVSDATLTQIRAAFAQPNGGVTLSPDHATVAALPVPGPTQAEQDRAATKTAVQTQLAGIPGIGWGSLTAAQKQAVIVAMLFKAGALDRSLTVLPLSTWL